MVIVARVKVIEKAEAKAGKRGEKKKATQKAKADAKKAHEKANDTKTEQKNSGKEPSVEEEQAKEAALKKVVIYGQKIAAWERSIQAKADAKKAKEVQQPAKTVEGVKVVKKAAHEKANDAKVGEKAKKKKATKKATFNDDYEEEQPEGTTKAKVTLESKAAPQHRDAQGPEAATKCRAIPEPSSQASKANPQLMLQTGFLAALCLLLQPEPRDTGGLPGRVRNLPGLHPPVNQALGPRDKGAK